MKARNVLIILLVLLMSACAALAPAPTPTPVPLPPAQLLFFHQTVQAVASVMVA